MDYSIDWTFFDQSILSGLLLWNYYLCVSTPPGAVPAEWVSIDIVHLNNRRKVLITSALLADTCHSNHQMIQMFHKS